MNVRTIGVVGAGLMGSGIIEQAARCGFKVIAREVDDQTVASGQKRVRDSMERAIRREKMSQTEREQAEGNIVWSTHLEDLAPCDLIVEAIVENIDAKKDLFRSLDRLTRDDSILASNTSSVSITALAAVTSKPERVGGAHFFNPVPVMGLVELVRGLQTSDLTMDTLRAFGEHLGKKVVVAKDTPGFIVNYLLVPYLLDAVRAVENGVASVDDIDTAMKLGTAVPMGPLTLLDFVGLDTTLFIADVMYEEFRDAKYAAPPLLRRMVNAGYCGKGKRGNRGFYDYN